MMKHTVPGFTVLALAVALSSAPARAETVLAWATSNGPGPDKFLNQPSAWDSAAGPNGTYATGRWEGQRNTSTFGGFPISPPAANPRQVEVVLAYMLSAELQRNLVEVSITTVSGTFGPIVVPPTDLNGAVGVPGSVTVPFDLLHEFTAVELSGPVSVKVACKRHGPAEGAEFLLDAVGLRLTLAADDSLYDLLLGPDPASLAGTPPVLVDVSSPVTVMATECFSPLCAFQVVTRDGDVQDVSVGLMPDGETVRVGFDDGRLDAPVDPLLTSVAAPSVVVADGSSTAEVRIRVTDSNGWPLGGHLNLQIDPLLLGPAQVSGSLGDLGDGTYLLNLVSLTPGTAVVQIVAEGVALQATPTVLFVAP